VAKPSHVQLGRGKSGTRERGAVIAGQATPYEKRLLLYPNRMTRSSLSTLVNKAKKQGKAKQWSGSMGNMVGKNPDGGVTGLESRSARVKNIPRSG